MSREVWRALEKAVSHTAALLERLGRSRSLAIQDLAQELGTELFSVTYKTPAYRPLSGRVAIAQGKLTGWPDISGGHVTPPPRWSLHDFAIAGRIRRALTLITDRAGDVIPRRGSKAHLLREARRAIEATEHAFAPYAKQIERLRALERLGWRGRS